VAFLSIENLTVKYQRPRDGSIVTAVDGVSVRVEKGEFVSVVGPSGCGKTSLLKVVDGQIQPSEGLVAIDGIPLDGSTSQSAMVFQDALLFPWFTIERNVGYGLECQGVSREDTARRARASLKLVGLSDWKDHYPHELSGGMQQRANLARAITVDAELLLMDEPFSALDAQTRELMQQELLRIWEDARRTVLFITHQIGEAIYLSDRVLVMSGRPGEIARDIPIDFPRPRPLELKRTAEFQALEDEIWQLIERDVRAVFAAGDVDDR
jgi:NitT/TauT family transport system ATP-binding protein